MLSGNMQLKLHLGLVTYNLAKDWDIPTIIKNCTQTKFEAVELRATHAHQVEVDLNQAQRREVRKQFEDSPVKLISLGSAFEYHAIDQAEVRQNIAAAKEYVQLAHDVGAKGIKVRPNGLQTEHGIPVEKTLAQIGAALCECGNFARDYGVEIRLEVHGQGTSQIPVIKKIIDYADCENVFVCWNSNQEDLAGGGLVENFNLLKDKIHFVHLRDLHLLEYPWRQLLNLLHDADYTGCCCAEIQESREPIRIMNYYRALFLSYQNLI